MLRRLDHTIWVAEQQQRYSGLSIGTRMTVIRQQETGELIVLSPIQPTPQLDQALAEIGVVSDIVAPNSYHHLYCNPFKQRYPQARLWGSAELQRKCPHLLIDDVLAADGPSPWADILLCRLAGLNTLGPFGPSPLHEFAFCHPSSRTLVLTDSAFNFDSSYPWPTRLITCVGGGYGRLEPTILERLASPDKQSIRRSIQEVLAWPFERVIVAHGAVVEAGGKAALARAYANVLGVPVDTLKPWVASR